MRSGVEKRSLFENPAFRFVALVGIASLFGDMTYEGGGSINGQFLGSLGASAATISIVAGLGEFLGYALRSVAGYVADRTKKPWAVSLVGYALNLFAVPAMAFAPNWRVASALILAERTGRAIRKPTIEAMLSYTTEKFGRGWVYSLNTALDETGATIGPLMMAFVLFRHGTLRFAYTLLFVSAALSLLSVVGARIKFPMPSKLEGSHGATARAKGFSRAYWMYMAGGACFASGLMSYELISFYLSSIKLVTEPWIPVLLAFATGSGVIANLVLGRTYDRVGLPVLVLAAVLSAAFTPLVFQGKLGLVLLAMPLWGIGYATQDTLLKAVVAGLPPKGHRSLAFGLFYAGYGCGWLIGSIVVGELFDHSKSALVIFAVAAQLVSIPFFVLASHMERAQS